MRWFSASMHTGFWLWPPTIRSSPRVARASALIGASVRNPKGEDLGEIEDVIVEKKEEVIALAKGIRQRLDPFYNTSAASFNGTFAAEGASRSVPSSPTRRASGSPSMPRRRRSSAS